MHMQSLYTNTPGLFKHTHTHMKQIHLTYWPGSLLTVVWFLNSISGCGLSDQQRSAVDFTGQAMSAATRPF